MRVLLLKPLPLLVFSMLSIASYSQDILWEKSYGGKHADYLMDAQPTADYGFILAGSSISDKNGNKAEKGKGDYDYWLWKMDEHAQLDWQKSFGGNGKDFLQSIALTTDGGFVLAGTSSSNSSKEGADSSQTRNDKKEDSKGGEDFWIIKLNAKGNEEWQKTIGGYGQEKLTCIKQTKDGGFIIGGSSASDSSADKKEDSYGGMDYWVVKLKRDGTIEWQKTIGGIYNDELKSIILTTDGGYLLGGNSNSKLSGNKTEDNYGLGDYWLVKLDSKANIQWQKTLGGDKDDQLHALVQAKNGDYIVGGNSNSDVTNSKTKSNKSGTDFWVLRLNVFGAIKWQETYNYGKNDVLTSLIENEDETILIGGYAKSEVDNRKQTAGNSIQKIAGKKSIAPRVDEEGINDYIALKIDAEGNDVFSKTVGSKGDESLKKLIQTRDGGYLFAGTSNGKASRDKKSTIDGNDFWVVKLKDEKKIKENKTPIEAIPNPTAQFTNVIVNHDFDTGTATLYDLAGRQLQQFSIDSRTVPVDLGSLPEGIYVVNIKTNKENGSVKIIKTINNK